MALRRAACVSASFAAIFHRNSSCSCSTSKTTNTYAHLAETAGVTLVSAATSSSSSLWVKGTTSARDVSLVNVEDMFGHADAAEEDATASPAAVCLSSSTHDANVSFLKWDEDDENVAGEGVQDLGLEGLINAALGEPCVADDAIKLDMNKNRSGVVCSSDGDGVTIAARIDRNLTEDGVDDDDDKFTATAISPGATLGIPDDGGDADTGVVNEDEDEDDVSAVLAEEQEQEQVEQLLRASQPTESTTSLFFSDKPHVVRGTVRKLSFDDAAAEGAELESVGEAMPSPQRA